MSSNFCDAHFLGEAPLDDRGKLLTPPIDRAQDELRQPMSSVSTPAATL
jgi:hypothetical protein